MRVSKIQINGFKRFDNLTIELGDNPRKIIALIGPNGSGKSSVLDSIMAKAHAYNNSLGGASHNIDINNYSKYSDPSYNSSYYQNISIYFDEGEYSVVQSRLNQLGIPKTIVSFRSAYRFSDNLNVASLQRIDDIINNSNGASLSNNIDDKITINYQRLYTYINSYRKANDLTDKQANQAIIGRLNDILLNCLDIQIVDVGDIVAGRGKLYFKTRTEENVFNYNVLSSGEKECVDILIDLFLKMDYYKNTIYIIDEPELHLNTSIQRKLMIEIDRIIPENCQLWISTHSIGFMRAFQEELSHKTQILDFSEKDYSVGANTIKPIKPNRENWNRIFRTAIDDLSHLIAPKRIIYCEGKFSTHRSHEELGIDAKVFNTIFSSEYSDTIFVSSGGNTELDQRADVGLAVLNKVFTDIEIWILKDRDFDSGKYVDESKRQEFLDLNSNRNRILNRWELENYLFDKEILSKFCLSLGHLFKDNLYNQEINDIVNQDVKSKMSFVRSCCSISYSISPEKFKENLSTHITPETKVYQELKNCIFDRK